MLSVRPCFRIAWLAASASPWQKPAGPPATAKLAQVASAKETTPAKEAAAQPAGFLNGGESLNYSLRWPGGATLGEAHLRARPGATAAGNSIIPLDASVPGFRSLRSLSFPRQSPIFARWRWKRKLPTARAILTRRPSSTTRKAARPAPPSSKAAATAISILARALTTVSISSSYARRELGQGRGVPPAAGRSVRRFLFGPHGIRRRAGCTVGGKRQQADHINLYLKGAAAPITSWRCSSPATPARTPPCREGAPRPSAHLSMELVR